MSYGAFYQAIPEDSDFFRLIKADREVELLLTFLWNHGTRPLDLWDSDREEMDDILDDMVEMLGFEDRAHVDRTISTLEAEIDRACATFPGLIDRMAYVEQVHSELEACLGSRFKQDGLADSRRLIGILLYGESRLNPQFGFPHDGLSLINAPAVEFGWRILSEIDPEDLYQEAVDGRDFREDYQSWRNLFREAAVCGEVVIIHGK